MEVGPRFDQDKIQLSTGATLMKQLSPAAFERARDSIKTQARPLDRSLFEYRFEQAPTESVLAELAHFQNGDGGFGHGLEPDVRTPASSALATGIGLRLLKELGCPADHPMVRRAVEFLLATSPRSIVADLLAEDLQMHLDYQIEHQTPQGTWEPTWSWGKFYPETWEQAKQEWRGSLTLDTLTTLRAFDRI